MSVEPSVQSSPILSDDRVRETLRREIDRAVNVERTFTRHQLALESGVNIHTIDAITTRDVAKHRKVCADVALSLAFVLGTRCVSALAGLIGHAARRLDEADEHQPMQLAATAMLHLSTIATAAADGRIDHTEQPGCQQAADMIIATVLPLSSAGRTNP